MPPDKEIEILRDENARLKAIVTRLELKDADRSGTLLQAKVERKALRRTVRSQEAQLSALQAAQAQLEIKDPIIKSQAEFIETIITAAQILPAPLSPLTNNPIAQAGNISAAYRATQQTAIDARVIQPMEAYIAELEHKLKDSNEEFEALHEIMLPCYQVGFWSRQRIREEDFVRRGGASSWLPPHITCDCSTHHADSLSDASILHYGQNIQVVKSFGTNRWTHYEQSYGVPPDIVMEQSGFRRFLNLITYYRNMQRYGREGSTSLSHAAALYQD